MAYNNLNQLPEEIIDVTKNTLEYLSLTGNNFSLSKSRDEDERSDEDDRKGMIRMAFNHWT